MPVKTSGQLSLRYDILAEVGGASFVNLSLRGLASRAGFGTPDAMSEFYGYSRAAFIALNIGPFGADGTGNDRNNRFNAFMFSRGDGNNSLEFGEFIGRTNWTGVRTIAMTINTTDLDSDGVLFVGDREFGPWVRVLTVNRARINGIYNWDANRFPFFRLLLDIQRGRENTEYGRTLQLWIA